MQLRFFADHCVSTYIINILGGDGHEVIRLGDQIPKDSSDDVVIKKAQELDAILISLNGDFSDIVSYPPYEVKGIISLQIGNHPEITLQLMEKLLSYIRGHADPRHYKGMLLLVEVHRIRERR